MKRKILFLCTTNSCRSQMAEGILRNFYGNKFEAFSAGAKPSYVHPFAVKVMAEIGIDISNQRSKSVEEFTGQEFDYVITLCGDYAKEVCPVFIGKAKERLHWNFVDPAEAEGSEEEVLTVFRKVRDEIKIKIDKEIKT
ncbi:MAG: arsenate reductase ArsC [Anaerolineae bacterium]